MLMYIHTHIHVHQYYINMHLYDCIRTYTVCVSCATLFLTAAAFSDVETALSAYLPARPRKEPCKLTSDSTRSLKQHSKSSLKAPSHSSLQAASQSSLKAPSQSSLKAPSQSSLKAPSQSFLKEPSQSFLKEPSQSSLKAPSQSSIKKQASKVTVGRQEEEREEALQQAGAGKEVGVSLVLPKDGLGLNAVHCRCHRCDAYYVVYVHVCLCVWPP